MIQTKKNLQQYNPNYSAAHSVPIKSTPRVATSANRGNNQTTSRIISGYFVNDQSYKQMVVERINKTLCCVLGLLVLTCLVSYYFVTISEIKLNQIQKDTLALTYENDEMQNKLDSLQSYSNVDKTVTQQNILKKAQQIMELPAQNTPSVKFSKDGTLKQIDVLSLGF